MCPVSMDLGYCSGILAANGIAAVELLTLVTEAHMKISVKYLPWIECFIGCKMCNFSHPRRIFYYVYTEMHAPPQCLNDPATELVLLDF